MPRSAANWVWNLACPGHCPPHFPDTSPGADHCHPCSRMLQDTPHTQQGCRLHSLLVPTGTGLGPSWKSQPFLPHSSLSQAAPKIPPSGPTELRESRPSRAQALPGIRERSPLMDCSVGIESHTTESAIHHRCIPGCTRLHAMGGLWGGGRRLDICIKRKKFTDWGGTIFICCK